MTVNDVLTRMDSMEITEWHTFFEMQEDELERSRRKSERSAPGEGVKPSIGDAKGRADAIAEARKAQGLE